MKYGMPSVGIAMSSSRMPTHARPMPSGALSRPIATASVSSWRTIRHRPAPSAVRIEISRWRTDARASSRFATFEQAIMSTSVTAPIIVKSISSTSPGIIHSRSGRTPRLQFWFSFGYAVGEPAGDRRRDRSAC